MMVLDSQGPMIGADLEMEYQTESCSLDAVSAVCTCSATASTRSTQTDGQMWPFSQFLGFMSRARAPGEPESTMDRLIAEDRSLSAGPKSTRMISRSSSSCCHRGELSSTQELE